MVVLALSFIEAKADWLCTHPQLCQVVADYYKLSNIQAPKLTKAIASNKDPHEVEPTTTELKNIYKARYLITGARELHPWITSILNLRSKKPELKTFSYDVNQDYLKRYPKSHKESLAHFWLYPDIKCDVFNKFQKWIERDKEPIECPYKEEALVLKDIKIEIPTIVSHDAIVPLLLSLGIEAYSIKGSGHHEEPNPKQLKEIHLLLKKHPKVLWIVEKQIHFPNAIEALKRKDDKIIHIDTNRDYPSNKDAPLIELAAFLKQTGL